VGGHGTQAIAAAISVDPDEGYYHDVHPWDREWYEGEEDFALPADLKPNGFDNNDGITLIRFKAGERLPGYAFITPSHLEGSHWKSGHGQGPWSAEEYLRFYYSTQEQGEWLKEVQLRMELALDRISRLARLMPAQEVKALLPGFGLKTSRLKAVAV
jgi:hypothetical protein